MGAVGGALARGGPGRSYIHTLQLVALPIYLPFVNLGLCALVIVLQLHSVCLRLRWKLVCVCLHQLIQLCELRSPL